YSWRGRLHVLGRRDRVSVFGEHLRGPPVALVNTMARATLPQIDLALDVSQIQHLCSLPGPWLTILLPAYPKAEQQIPDSVRRKSLLRTATGPNIPGGVPAPVRELAESEALLQGGKGIALFSAPGFTGGYRVDSALGDKLVFAEYPF